MVKINPQSPDNDPAPEFPRMEMPPDVKPVYVNLVRISHSPSEFVYDFSQLLPAQESIQVVSRLIMSPTAAKMFLHALAENLSRYEASFGEIPVPPNSSLVQELFRPTHPPENP